ncbi:dr1-associated corepressor isoform X2 [Venturia canescens]|uniref:dr1-associated corepressor isoform X2 n=1 Tax=Venturia canescens TaxID=32260 RepID=UPI001C9C9D3B|nr:dr1-associated corepressor isoform X2 [Venturia canescens]
MPCKKKKYNARFPAGRIKKIMQTDEEVGKVAQAVPVIISRTLELFVHSLLTKTMQITNAKNAKTLRPSHMKQCILSESRFDFLKDLVKGLPDVSGADDDVPTPPLTPAPMGVNMVPGAAGVPPTLHSDGRLSRTSRTSKDGNDLLILDGTDELPKIFIPSMSNSTTPIGTPSMLLPTSQQHDVPNFQISMPSSFQVKQPNFYTEVEPVNLPSNTHATNIVDQPTSNFDHTADIDEDYDT